MAGASLLTLLDDIALLLMSGVQKLKT
ncbi:protein of unknown function [Shewanella benthica]|uniref:Uncharacterized protein n=1 Tax=Shewanella benthica TaxID=43661 RepID=A0A330M078_9GAMM|nr:protein of unknown function [Shewanella benthica]